MLDTVLTFWQEHLVNYTYAFAIVLGFFILSRLVPLLLTMLFSGLAKRSKLDYSKLSQAFSRPLSFLILATGLYLAALNLLGGTAYGDFFTKVYRSLVIVSISQGLYNLAGSTSGQIGRAHV